MAWIRRLAYALVKDADVADDISQETWLAAHDRLPADRPLRPWLARVVLNVTRMRSRAETRRDAREAAVPVLPAEPQTDALVDRVALQRALVDAVLALAEPLRTTVLLHYFEGLSSAAIARPLGIPDGTVRRRLKDALDELRAHFAKRERRGLAALAPIAGLAKPRASLTFAVGGISMKKLFAAIAAVLALLVLVG